MAVCSLNGVDLNGWMVAPGWAFAYRRYSNGYLAEESGARAARRGVRRGDVVLPWDWRRGKRLGGSRATTHQEIKRRTHIVRVFPNARSCLRLVRALAVEIHEDWLEANRYLNMIHLKEHCRERLRKAA